MNYGNGCLFFTNKPTGPAAAITAYNGVSIDDTGHVVLGNDVGDGSAQLESNREIPMSNKDIRFVPLNEITGLIKIGTSIDSGAKLQVEGTTSTKRRIVVNDFPVLIDGTVAIDPVNDNFSIFVSSNTSE
jgi:hypothetical protein